MALQLVKQRSVDACGFPSIGRIEVLLHIVTIATSVNPAGLLLSFFLLNAWVHYSGVVVVPTCQHFRISGLVHFANFFNVINSTTFVLFSKYCPIVDQLGSKDSSRDFQLNCVISYFFIYI